MLAKFRLFILFGMLSMFFVGTVAPLVQENKIDDTTPLAKLFAQHRKGYPETDDSWSCDSALFYMKEVLKRYGNIQDARLRKAVTRAMFSASKAANTEFATAPKVYVGTQMLEDLEVVLGKVGSEQKHLVASLDNSLSDFGAASLLLLLATPQVDTSLLRARQKVL